MPTARRYQVYPELTPYYHCISRCVRRAWLCGKDPVSGGNFDHRKGWIESRLLHLSKIFAIDLTAYAVMSSHYHVVLRLDIERSENWTAHEVVGRWGQLCRLSPLANAFLENQALSDAEFATLMERVDCWRGRLSSLSWFMRFVNEPLARLANSQDGCTGRFWEGRFKCQALLDESAVVACMVYVDLNPVRAGLTDRPETARHTSISRRCTKRHDGLQPFAGEIDMRSAASELPIDRKNYLELLDWSGRTAIEGKPGKVPNSLAPILQRLGGQQAWLSNVDDRPSHGIFFGRIGRLREICEAVGRSWVWKNNRGRSTSSRLVSLA